MKLNKIKALIINIIKINEIFLYVKNAHNLFYINTFLVFGAAVFESFSISLILPILKNLQNDIVEKGLIERTLEQVLKIFNIEFNIGLILK